MGKRGATPGFKHFRTEVHRARIQASQLINRLQKFALGKAEYKLTISEIRAIEVLLRKCVPDLVQADMQATITHRYVVEIPPLLGQDEWQRKYALPGTGNPPPLIEHQTLTESLQNANGRSTQENSSTPSMPLFDLKMIRTS